MVNEMSIVAFIPPIFVFFFGLTMKSLPIVLTVFFEIAKKCLTPIKSTMHNLRTKKVDLENSVVNCDRIARSYLRIEFCYSA